MKSRSKKAKKVKNSKITKTGRADLLPVEIIANKILMIRGQKVMIDRDLAKLYGVEAKYLKRQVRRNIERFPEDFMFEISKQEYRNLRSHFGTLKRGEHSKYLPYVFTEQGVSMLSSVLNSKRAIQVNIQIMRTFAQMRRMMLSYKELKEKIEKMESKYDKQFRIVFQALKQLLEPPKSKMRRGVPKSQGKIGF